MTRWREAMPGDDDVDEGSDLHSMQKAGIPPPEVDAEKAARPVIKSLGGKTRLLPEILKRLPSKVGRYHEPFVGGGAVFFGLVARGQVGSAHLADMNDDVVNLYCVVRDDVEKLIAHMARDKDLRNDEKAYYRVRASEPSAPIQRAARTLYMNKTCFNGLARYNSKGKFNSPFGRYDNPTICDADNLHRASVAFDRAKIEKKDFEKSCRLAKEGDVVYLDPPYLPLSATSSFTAYTSDGFSLGDHERLRDVMLDMADRGVVALLSNSAAPAIRSLYSGRRFKVEEVHAARAINSDASKRGKIKELLIRARSS